MLFLLGSLGLALAASDSTTHNGRARELSVKPPRIDTTIVIDGALSEAAWSRAAVLTGFSRYAPTDNAAADDSTDVLIWYSPQAIHIGIRAYAAPGSVNATLADRDKIYSDDYVAVFLATFNDGRQATILGANPLGVQGDGVLVERGAGGGGFGGMQVGREPTDISPDFVFQSKGQVTEFGYVVELRIPFRSLRYGSAPTQTWGINVLRRVQSRGYEYSWAPAERAAVSYIAQFGKLEGLTGLDRGQVIDVNPIVTARAAGTYANSSAPFDYTTRSEFGANMRWGITPNLTVNGTVNPDFAEVESDAGQLVFDPRQALFFAERRPFFLDGIEQFAVPGSLIYTRRIADPLGAAKVTGRSGSTSYAFLSAVDSRAVSTIGDRRAAYNLLRVQHDLGRSSRAGIVVTDRREGPAANQVAGADARLVWRGGLSGAVQAAASRTVDPGLPDRTGSLLSADLRRTGRSFAARWRVSAMSDDFDAQSGFISRPAIAQATLDHSYTIYGREGSFVRSAALDVLLDGTWNYRSFIDGDPALEEKLHFNTNYELRGGWRAGASVLVETFRYDAPLYGNLFVAQSAPADTVPFVGRPAIGNLDYSISLSTPSFRTFSGSMFWLWGRDENFFEWAPADIGFLNAAINWRPDDKLRMTGSYNLQYYKRYTDGSMVGRTHLPRLRVEYQVTRAIFIRAVGQLQDDYADELRDDGRTNAPLFRRVQGQFVRARGFSTVNGRPNSRRNFRPEVLFSYAPSPGTVLYAGYNGVLENPNPMRPGIDGYSRVRDGFFLKMSYLLRR